MDHSGQDEPIRAGTAVLRTDGQRIGTVRHLSATHLVVEREAFVHYISREAIVRVEDEAVYLPAPRGRASR